MKGDFCCALAGKASQRVSNSANVKLTPAAMQDNLAEKVDGCPLSRGCYILFVYNWDHENCPLYGVAGCPLFRGF